MLAAIVTSIMIIYFCHGPVSSFVRSSDAGTIFVCTDLHPSCFLLHPVRIEYMPRLMSGAGSVVFERLQVQVDKLCSIMNYATFFYPISFY
ncbi:hypothetical protein EV424DRAFT_622322 [Suillus variegatus]|nr:hypothetical protein EV424DRAFT_622322 [Suillus variegatus]